MAQDDGEQFRRHWWGYGVGLVVLYTFAGPVTRFLSAVELYWIGLYLFGALTFAYWAFTSDGAGRYLNIIAGLCVAGVLIIAIPALSRAQRMSAANDRSCRVIEREMKRGTPRRADLPDMFQALGCRPQLDAAPMRPGTRGERP